MTPDTLLTMLDALVLLIIFIFGTAIGSFLNVVAYRSVHGGSLFLDRSKCPHCKHQLETLDLVPILSFLFLKGRCRYCKEKISWQYPVVEATTGILFAITTYIVMFHNQIVIVDLISTLSLIYLLFVTSVLIAIFITDFRDGLIPDKIILPSIAIALAFKVLLAVSTSQEVLVVAGSNFLTFSQIGWDILAGLMGGAFFLLLVVFSKGKAMGGGDIKLAVFMGLVLGLSKLALALFLAFLTGAIVSLILIFVGKKRFGQTIAFGPFLVFGAYIALIWGQQILDWYLRINR